MISPLRTKAVTRLCDAYNDLGYSVFKLRPFCAVVLACALLSAARAQLSVPDQQYRCPPTEDECGKTHKLPAFELGASDVNHHPYTINYVEFTDKGVLWDPHELKDAVKQITAAADGGSQHPLVVVYVHGWQNNASNISGDVVKFSGFISRLADDYPVGLPGKAPQVVGIYLAWRGLTIRFEPFKYFLSYWPRRQVAKNVGRTGIKNAVEVIKDAVNINPTVRANTFLIFAGHSFGARVLENAIDGLDAKGNPGFMRQYFEEMHKTAQTASIQHAKVSDEQVRALPLMPADLVVYVNAATSSAMTRKRVRQVKKDCPNFRSHPICSADPLYIAFTSTNDLATGLVMPIANLVLPDLISDKLNLISAANSPWMHTHHAPEPGCPQGEVICFDIARTNQPPTRYYLPRIPGKAQVPKSEDQAFDSDPFWIFNVHSNLVNGHGDVWNPNVANMLTVIIQNNRRFQQVRAAAVTVAP